MSTSTAPTVAGGRYLTFYLGAEEYGVEILKVREIIGIMPITRVPRTPASVRGVINLRGKVIPVVDLRFKFGLEGRDHDQQTCIIVVQSAGVEFGVVVDRVSEVADITAGEVSETPDFGAETDTDYLLGIAKTGARVRLLLDIDRVVSHQELSRIAAVRRKVEAPSDGDQAVGASTAENG